MSENIYPGLREGHENPYFPPLKGMPECVKCERKRTCFSREKYQRDFRGFSYTSGRCPRLPDWRGFVEHDERNRYAATFPLVHVTRIEHNTLSLKLFLPNQGRGRVVNYHRKFNHWWVRLTENGEQRRRFLKIEGDKRNLQDILNYMERHNTNFCIFRCEIEDNWF